VSDTAESLRAEWSDGSIPIDAHVFPRVVSFIERALAALEAAERERDALNGQLSRQADHTMVLRQQVAALREALLYAQRFMPRLDGYMHDHKLLEETKS
jgi:hypothetical protein